METALELPFENDVAAYTGSKHTHGSPYLGFRVWYQHNGERCISHIHHRVIYTHGVGGGLVQSPRDE